MYKEFDLWNESKKKINERSDDIFYRAREIRWCSLGMNIGFEQDGTGDERTRPVVVLKGFSRHVCIVIPLTSSAKKNPYHLSLGKIGDRDAYAIISQIRLIDIRRLGERIDTLPSFVFEELRKAVKDIL